MILILFATIMYLLLALSNSYLLAYLSVPVFLLVFYVLPLVINYIIYKFQKTKWKFHTSLILPTLSVMSYLVFAYITSMTGAWLNFAELNTISDSSMSLEIVTDLFSVSQILFVVALFYGVSLTLHLITQKITKKGVKYA